LRISPRLLPILCLATTLLPAQAPPSGVCGEAFLRLARACRLESPLKARFKHTLTAPALNQSEVEEGTVLLAPGGKMRWEYSKPPGKLAVADGKTGYLYLPEDKEVMVQKAAGGAGAPLLLRLLAGQVRLEEEAACEGIAVRGDRAVLNLRLLRPDAEVRQVEVTTEAATGQVLQVRYHDGLGNEVTLSLSDQERPKSVSESEFSFRPPPGVRIIQGE
jgi:outer membrane lipoprotein carrier protein